MIGLYTNENLQLTDEERSSATGGPFTPMGYANYMRSTKSRDNYSQAKLA